VLQRENEHISLNPPAAWPSGRWRTTITELKTGCCPIKHPAVCGAHAIEAVKASSVSKPNSL
jgi:hypothetical protein